MTRRALALLLLREAGPRGVETAEFLEAGVGSRYGARLLELRREGHRIESERIRDGAWRYVLNEVDVGGGPTPDVRQAQRQGIRQDGLASPGRSSQPTADVGAAQLFPDDDAWLALRAKDAA